MIFNISAGHNPDGKIACGAIGILKESTEARKVKDEVIRLLRFDGHTVYDCTVEDGTSQSNVLNKIVAKSKEHDVDFEISIHFNSSAGSDLTGDGKNKGTEVLVYSLSSASVGMAKDIVNAISALGFKNRGVIARPELYVLKHTKAPALLVECCFVNDKDDVELYNYKSMAKAIVKGILGKTVTEKKSEDKVLYRVQVGAFGNKSNANILLKNVESRGFDAVIVKVGSLYKVQVGAFGIKENAENMLKKLHKAGFDAFITKS